jgi:ankyrin repeat protein
MLFLAVSYNDSNAIKALLERGANINTIDSKSSYTPLMAAALECKINAVGYLLIRGANPNIKNKNGRTALHLSIINKCPEILKDLILAGANIDIKDHYGKKPLDYVNDEIIAKQIVQYFKNPNLAILSCSASAIKQCVKDAIDNGADINTTDSEGNTPLMLATAAHSVDLVNLLINKGADTNKLNKKGQDALALAKKLNYWDIANIIETIKIKINFDQCDIIYYNDPQTEFNNKSESLNKDESNFTKQPHKITKRKHSD